MTRTPSWSVSSAVAVTLVFLLLVVISLFTPMHGIGTGSTVAVSYESGTVCGVVAGEPHQSVRCFKNGQNVAVPPNAHSFSSISGGGRVFCGLRSGGDMLLCWDTVSSGFPFRRVYLNETVRLDKITVGDDQICATFDGSGTVKCWRDEANSQDSPSGSDQLSTVSAGLGFTCGIMKNSSRVRCWGREAGTAREIEEQFRNTPMSAIEAGGAHACGLNTTGFLLCKGSNSSGQVDVPSNLVTDASKISLGANHSCAIRRLNGSVVCWGGRGEFSVDYTEGVSFELVVSGSDFTCGLTSGNFSVLCWGPGWLNFVNQSNSGLNLPLPQILPGPCVQSSCSKCGVYPLSQQLCYNSGIICRSCEEIPIAKPLPSPSIPPSPSISPPSSPSKSLTGALLAFAIVGSIGAFCGICTAIYCLYAAGVCCRRKKIHNSVQPRITGATNSGHVARSNSSPPSRTSTIRRQSSRMRRQRSGTSTKHAEEFTLSELAKATENFSSENRIGAGSFGVVYRGKLWDGREVAIKRGETETKARRFQEKETAFESELAFLSRLHHKHLVRLAGYCEEDDERLLVYDYMKNGALYDHLHDLNNVEKSSSFVNSWKIRIRIALDASRGIEYLHNYAVPPIIHRDIKSSNILLDSNWTARVSDFGLSLLGPDSDRDFRPARAAGTVGYIDPEYYSLNVLTEKSDVYGLGIVLLELLTGRRAVFKMGENGGTGTPMSVVDFAVPAIMAGELAKILDRRVGPPEVSESEAVELVAYTAMHCVNLEGKERPSMADIVTNLERALTLCEDSHGSISSGPISILSE